jgi:hypothetical protein
MKHRGLIVGGMVAVVLVLSGWAAARSYSRRDPVTATHGAPDARAPEGVRVRLEVLNATTIHGLARHATLMLRDHGFDVLLIGSSSERLDSVQVLDRSGHPEWAARVAKALGGARVIERPDTSHYVDVTVLLGRGWRPPAKPFYP